MVMGQTLYVLNEYGENLWSAQVIPGRDNNGVRLLDDDCQVIAKMLAHELNKTSLDATQKPNGESNDN